MGTNTEIKNAKIYTVTESGEYKEIATAENIECHTEDIQIQSVEETKTDRGYKAYQYIVHT